VYDQKVQGKFLKTCNVDEDIFKADPFSLVIFDAAGIWGPQEANDLIERDGCKWIDAQDGEVLLWGLR